MGFLRSPAAGVEMTTETRVSVIDSDEDSPAPSIYIGADQSARLIQAFFDGRNQKTVEAYRSDLTDFARHVRAKSVEALALMLIGHGAVQANLAILDYRAALMTRGLSPASINRRLAAIRSLLKLAKALGFIAWDLIAKNVRTTPYRDTRGPSVTNVRRLLAAVSKRRDKKGVRDFALLRLLYDLALRRNEVVTLDLTHVDLGGAVLHVLRKGNVERQPMTMPAPTAAAVKAWLVMRGPESGALFTNLDRAAKGCRLTGVSVNRVVAKWGSCVGLRLTAHQLRHAAITHALDATNGDVRAVARFSGHKQIQTLLVYDDNRTDMAARISRTIAASADPEMSL